MNEYALKFCYMLPFDMYVFNKKSYARFVEVTTFFIDDEMSTI